MPFVVTKVEPWWQPLETFVDRQTLALTTALFLVLRQPAQHIPQPFLASLLFAHDMSGALQLVQQTVTTLLPPALAQVLQYGIGTAIVQGQTVMDTTLLAEVLLPDVFMPDVFMQAQGRLAAYVAARVALLMATTLAPLPWVLRQAVHPDVPMHSQVAEIVAQVGLAAPQAQTVVCYRDGLEEAEFTSEHLDTLVTRRAQVLLQQRAEAIAETELMAAVNQGMRWAVEDAVAAEVFAVSQLRRYWELADDDACRRCRKIAREHRQGVGLFEAFQTAEGPVLDPPLHSHCVTGDTLVAPGGRIAAVSKRWYDGEIIALTTAEKKYLTCTPNHPILTRHGWLAAGQLIKGSEIICSSSKQGIMAVNHHIKDMPSRIEQIAQAFGFTDGVATREIPMTPQAFHGDGEGSKVAIIWANRLLNDKRNATFSQHASDDFFQHRVALALLLLMLRPPRELTRRLTCASNSPMGCYRLLLSLLRSHQLPFQQFSFPVPPWLNPTFQQVSTNHIARNLMSISQSFFRIPFVIETDKIVRVERKFFHGYVFNLQTDLGWYISNDIITHNCRCLVEYTLGK